MSIPGRDSSRVKVFISTPIPEKFFFTTILLHNYSKTPRDKIKDQKQIAMILLFFFPIPDIRKTTASDSVTKV
jgi:hypothetical protein